MNINPAHGVQTATDPPKTSSNSSWLMTLLDGSWFFSLRSSKSETDIGTPWKGHVERGVSAAVRHA